MTEDFISTSEENHKMPLDKKIKYYKSSIWLLKLSIIVGIVEGSYFAYDFLFKIHETKSSLLIFLYEKAGFFILLSIFFKLILYIFYIFYPKINVTSRFIRELKSPGSCIKNMNSNEECMFFLQLVVYSVSILTFFIFISSLIVFAILQTILFY